MGITGGTADTQAITQFMSSGKGDLIAIVAPTYVRVCEHGPEVPTPRAGTLLPVARVLYHGMHTKVSSLR